MRACIKMTPIHKCSGKIQTFKKSVTSEDVQRHTDVLEGEGVGRGGYVDDRSHFWSHFNPTEKLYLCAHSVGIIVIQIGVCLLLSSAEAEHGYASVLPYTSDFSRKKTKASPMSRKTQNNR